MTYNVSWPGAAETWIRNFAAFPSLSFPSKMYLEMSASPSESAAS